MVLGSCANEFTIQQQARMHCYIDRNYQLLLEHDGISPSTLPLAPRVLSSSNGKVYAITSKAQYLE